jgi:hypothetical protein
MKSLKLMPLSTMDLRLCGLPPSHVQPSLSVLKTLAGGDFDVLDIALAPWGLRLFVLEHYRGLQVCVRYRK